MTLIIISLKRVAAVAFDEEPDPHLCPSLSLFQIAAVTGSMKMILTLTKRGAIFANQWPVIIIIIIK